MKKATREREHGIMQAIRETLEAHRFRVLRMNSGKAFLKTGGAIQLAEEGTPDLLAIPPYGIVWWVEVKRPGEELKPDQKLFHADLMSRGQFVCTVDSVEDILKLLADAGLCRVAGYGD